MDSIDFKILQAIDKLEVVNPRVDKINDLVRLDPEELGARLGVLEMDGYIKTRSGDPSSEVNLPNGMAYASLTNNGRRALTGQRWG